MTVMRVPLSALLAPCMLFFACHAQDADVREIGGAVALRHYQPELAEYPADLSRLRRLYAVDNAGTEWDGHGESDGTFSVSLGDDTEECVVLIVGQYGVACPSTALNLTASYTGRPWVDSEMLPLRAVLEGLTPWDDDDTLGLNSLRSPRNGDVYLRDQVPAEATEVVGSIADGQWPVFSDEDGLTIVQARVLANGVHAAVRSGVVSVEKTVDAVSLVGTLSEVSEVGTVSVAFDPIEGAEDEPFFVRISGQATDDELTANRGEIAYWQTRGIFGIETKEYPVYLKMSTQIVELGRGVPARPSHVRIDVASESVMLPGTLGAVEDLRINGAEASVGGPLPRAQPLELTWADVEGADQYEIAIWWGDEIVRIFALQNHLVVPERLLERPGQYYFEVVARSCPSCGMLEIPLQRSFPVEESRAWSAVFDKEI